MHVQGCEADSAGGTLMTWIVESALPLTSMRADGENVRHVGGKSCTCSTRIAGCGQRTPAA